ncbi:unnamed protein product [Dovyalis caffra]|uniref:Glutaredoxin domain-containing protein n=1 Tax=Dovyalis caffra TaxID=77055 RepID=A0AAV1QWU3_9ROSI|nr:unnamed protein product [Dovyalis caffra]
MWPDWLRSPSRFPSSPRTQPPSPRFHCSSFKDIQTLIIEEPEPISPRKPSLFHRVRISTSVLRTWAHRNVHPSIRQSKSLPHHHDPQHIILYFTSLRIVRRTFEDCRSVRSILRGFCVPIDERDLSMDGMYLDELQEIVGSKKVTLPIVFIGGKYIGGVKEITELHESGDLKKLIGGLPLANTNACDSCGGLRFVLCGRCSGSHKIYTVKHGFKDCTGCNANGLIRCPSCVPLRRGADHLSPRRSNKN